jgi:hypothetical protein
MLWQFGFATSLNCLAQAWHAEAGRERRTKASLVYERECALLAGDAP